MINDWAVNHKTIIVCNGGNNGSLLSYIELFNNKQNQYPWVVFNEDDESLNGIMTGVAILLPDDVYSYEYSEVYNGYVSLKDGRILNNDTSFEYRLVDRIKSAKLAC